MEIAVGAVLAPTRFSLASWITVTVAGCAQQASLPWSPLLQEIQDDSYQDNILPASLGHLLQGLRRPCPFLAKSKIPSRPK